MEAYQLVAVAVMVAMGFVVHSTVRLNAHRKDHAVERRMINVRDLQVLLRPSGFPADEVRLVRRNWVGCAVLLVLALALFALVPEDVVRGLGTADGP